MEKKQQHFFHKSGWAVFSVFVWEMVEELLEEAIAYFVSSVFALFIVKTLSTLAIVATTIGLKSLLKRLFKPIVKTLTYKEGNDKMELLKKYWTRVWGNKITGTSVGIGFAGLSYFQTIIPFATHCWWIALLVFVAFYNLAIFFGGETLNQIQTRLAEATIKKEEQAIIKEAMNRIAKQEKQATQTQADKEKAEAKEKAEIEFNAKVELKMAEIINAKQDEEGK